jgi:hypothetical protein
VNNFGRKMLANRQLVWSATQAAILVLLAGMNKTWLFLLTSHQQPDPYPQVLNFTGGLEALLTLLSILTGIILLMAGVYYLATRRTKMALHALAAVLIQVVAILSAQFICPTAP